MSDRRARTLASSKTWASRSSRPSTASRHARPSRPARSLVVGRPGGGAFFVSFVRPSGPGSGPDPRARLVRRGLRQRRDRTTVRKKRRKPPGPVSRTARPGGLCSFISFIRTRATRVRAGPPPVAPIRQRGLGQMRAERRNELNEVKAARPTSRGLSSFLSFLRTPRDLRPGRIAPAPPRWRRRGGGGAGRMNEVNEERPPGGPVRGLSSFTSFVRTPRNPRPYLPGLASPPAGCATRPGCSSPGGRPAGRAAPPHSKPRPSPRRNCPRAR
jgi:hypothetical protein